MARHLVLARCGGTSLHEGWLAGAVRRSWDLALAPYEDIPPHWAAEWRLPCVPGQKWTGLAKILSDWQGWRAYDYIWLPDDDIAADAQRVNMLFGLAEAFGAALAAPALSADSYHFHAIVMQNRQYVARAVSFVEVMMPCFSRDALARILPLLGETPSGMGWGYDYVWSKLLGYRDIYIFDAVTMRHTRPSGGRRSPEQARRLIAEMEGLMAKYEARPLMKCLAGYKPGGRVAYATPEAFLAEILHGFAYLRAAKPALFEAIAQQQMQEI